MLTGQNRLKSNKGDLHWQDCSKTVDLTVTYKKIVFLNIFHLRYLTFFSSFLPLHLFVCIWPLYLTFRQPWLLQVKKGRIAKMLDMKVTHRKKSWVERRKMGKMLITSFTTAQLRRLTTFCFHLDYQTTMLWLKLNTTIKFIKIDNDEIPEFLLWLKNHKLFSLQAVKIL